MKLLIIVLNGQPINFPTDENGQNIAKLIIELGQILENGEMIQKGLEILGIKNGKSDMTIEDAFKMIKINQNLIIPQNIEEVYFVISSNLHLINDQKEKEKVISKLKGMNQEQLEMIFSSDKLVVNSEDSLFDLITEMGPEYYFLYDYVEIEYLSVEKVKLLIRNISNYDVSLHPLLWSSICRRLVIDVSSVIDREKIKIHRYKNNDKIAVQNPAINCENGIFKYLQNSANSENVYSSKIVDVEVSGIDSGAIENIFNQSKNTYLRVRDSQNSFIIVDFKDKKVNLSKYYLSVTSKSGTSRNRPKSWVIEGSNDKKEWEKIDERINDSFE